MPEQPGVCFVFLLGLSLLGSAGCGGVGAARLEFGERFDATEARPLSEVLAAYRFDAAGSPAVVSGTIGEVCASSGCWFVLHDIEDGRGSDLFVDLKRGADFTVPREIRGRTAFVKGRIVGKKPDLELHATGLIVSGGGDP